MGKALLIKSSAGTKDGIQGVWHQFDQITPYIQGIETGDLIENIDAETLNRMISGLPNVWARAYAFIYALKYTQRDANIQTSGLIKFYEKLINEWKGLLALLALFPDRIRITDPVEFSVENIQKLYNVPEAFGRMLFEDSDLWCNPVQLQKTKKEKPFVQLIYYNNILVGATSPYTLLFTAIDYDHLPQSADLPWYRDGRFDDPIEFGNLNNDQLQKIYLLLSNIIKHFPKYENEVQLNRNGKERINLTPVFVFLQKWRDEIKNKGRQLVQEGALDSELIFSAPYTQLFRIKQDLFYKNGVFSFNDNSGENIDIQKILLQDDFIYSIPQVDERQPLSESAVYLLSALDPNDANKTWYFPIPLSTYGLKLFKNQLKDLIAPIKDDKHDLKATFKHGEFKLIIELFLRVDGKKQTPVVKEYQIKLFTGAIRNIIMWPNFISKDWDNYYLYSEYPSNGRDIKFVPFFKDFSETGGFEAGGYVLNDKKEIVYIDTDKYGTDLQTEHLVRYPVEIATSEDHPYEVIRTNKPIGGLEIRALINGKDHVCGYLVVKNADDDSMGDKKLKDLSHETNFNDVVIGIDFGSNNSCICFSKRNDSQVNPIKYNNRRIFLFGAEIIDPLHEKTAQRNELLFYQNESSENGQIKSWVHDHSHRYISAGMEQEEISGGVPIFEHNLIIHDMNERTITTNAGTLHHSMKWLTDMKGKEKKKAYLKTVWLKVCADLYANRLLPKELRWSYPGSFSQFDVLQYEQMYNEFTEVPIKNVRVEVSYQPSTEAEAVCNYALTNVSLSTNNILLGIDVGGSTSDVLVVAMNRAERAFKMNKQSSLRMAAGILSDVIKNSDDIRRAIYKYHESPACKIKVANIRNIIDKPNTSPFYLNAILDRLRDEDFNGFYSSLAQSTPSIFAIPAFVSGILLYYSGMLIAKTINENNYSNIKIVDFLPFGKGGRIFDWLDTYPGRRHSSEYYNNCFRAGFGEGSENIRLEKKDSVRKDNKSEVAKGLSAPQKVTVDETARQNSDIFGEQGFKFYPKGSNKPIDLKADDNIKAEHLEEMDFGIEIPEKFEEFNKFLDIFIDFVGPRRTGIVKNTGILEQKRNELYRELKAFIINDIEWQKADEQKRTGQPFAYKHSMFVLEGMCFLDKFVVPEVFKS